MSQPEESREKTASTDAVLRPPRIDEPAEPDGASRPPDGDLPEERRRSGGKQDKPAR